jgi:hypothetical protein
VDARQRIAMDAAQGLAVQGQRVSGGHPARREPLAEDGLEGGYVKVLEEAM